MSLYQLQQCLFDHLRRLEAADSTRRPDDVQVDGYELSDAERAAAAAGDVGAFHSFGVHPVIINGFCRANGWKRADYRTLFPAGEDAVTQPARWRGFASRADGKLGDDGRVRLGVRPKGKAE